jgi:hypothetical protein
MGICLHLAQWHCHYALSQMYMNGCKILLAACLHPIRQLGCISTMQLKCTAVLAVPVAKWQAPLAYTGVIGQAAQHVGTSARYESEHAEQRFVLVMMHSLLCCFSTFEQVLPAAQRRMTIMLTPRKLVMAMNACTPHQLVR